MKNLPRRHPRSITPISLPFFLITAFLVISLGNMAQAAVPGPEERIQCQTIIEDIFWSHRIWPAANTSPKPSRSEIIGDRQIRDEVMTNLHMERLLATRYGIQIDRNMLQNELNRMATQTRAPARLQQLFTALSEDPDRIGECLVRPRLVENLLRQHYATDKEEHAGLRAMITDLIKTSANSDALVASGAQLQHLRYLDERSNLASDCRDGQATSGPFCQALPGEQIDLKLQTLQQQNTITESEFAFSVERLLAKSAESLEVEKYTWAKKGFNGWLDDQLSQTEIEQGPSASPRRDAVPLTLPELSPSLENTPFDQGLSANTPPPADSWAPPGYFPEDRWYHSSVWTGTEMIIWGGIDKDNNLREPVSWHYNPATDTWRRVDGAGGPTVSRVNHTTVWTGTEMIVWGGQEGDNVKLNSGWRYNPTSTNWTSVTVTGAPDGRFFHSAVWSGSEMIVWGGVLSPWNPTNTGGRYNPASDTWTATSLTNAPDERYFHTAVWTGTEMIIWGGQYYNTGGRYNPVTDSWTATTTTNAPTGRDAHVAIWTGSEMIIWGGATSATNYVNTGGRYDPSADSWTATTTTGAPTARYSTTAVWADTMMIIWGGTEVFPTNSGACYNPASDSWTPTTLTDAPAARQGHSALWTGDEMLIWGGWALSTLSSGARYAPDTNSWAVLTTTGWEPDSLSRGVAVWTGNEVIVWGGSNSATGGVYVPATDTWTPTSSTDVPSARYSHTAVWNGTHMIVWGGQTNAGTPFNTGGRYNPVLDSWQATSTTEAPSGRSHHTAVWTGSEMVVWGGYRSDPFTHYHTGGRYDPLMNTWGPIAETGAPTARREHVAVWTGSEMLVWGGWNGATEYSSGGRYTPDTDSWQPTSTANTPLGRHALSAAWTGTELLVWGGEYWNGSTFSYLNSGGRYNPASNAWAEHEFTTSGAPVGRYCHTGVWTGVHFLVWGGRNNTEYLNSGGLYNPETDNWSTTTTIGAPTPRMYHTAVWTGNEMVVWGGSTGSIDERFGIYYPYGYYAIGGTLAGIDPGETIVMQNNGADDLAVNSNGSFTFSEPLIDHTGYHVRVVNQPAASGRYCSVSNGTGTVSGADVTNIEVDCFTLTLENVITALQVLSGMAPVGADLDTLKTLSENKKVELSVPILILRELAAP